MRKENSKLPKMHLSNEKKVLKKLLDFEKIKYKIILHLDFLFREQPMDVIWKKSLKCILFFFGGGGAFL